jgi:hypothetical protein
MAGNYFQLFIYFFLFLLPSSSIHEDCLHLDPMVDPLSLSFLEYKKSKTRQCGHPSIQGIYYINNNNVNSLFADPGGSYCGHFGLIDF